MLQRIIFFFSLIAIFIACNNSGSDQPAITGRFDDPATIGTMVFKRTKVIDKETGLHALTLLFPEDWKVSYETQWVSKDRTSPFKYSITAIADDTINRIDFYPSLSFITSTKPTEKDSTSTSIGIRYSSVLPPSALDAIKKFLIPEFRPDITDMRIVEQVPLQNIESMDSSNNQPIESGIMRIKYRIKNELVEELFFAAFRKEFVSVDNYDPICEWHIENAVSCRMHENYSDDQLKILQTAVMSMRYGKEWILHFDHAINQLRKGNNEIDVKVATVADNAEKLYTRYQRALGFPAYVLSTYQPGIDYYVDKSGDILSLPKGFSIAWRNDYGQYVLADVATFQPPDTGTTWYEIKLNANQGFTTKDLGTGMEDPLNPLSL